MLTDRSFIESPLIAFLSDYGTVDEFAGVCRAVMLERTPTARIVDLTHSIARHDVRAGALALESAAPYLKAQAICAVVDPEVGGHRRAIAIESAAGTVLVGPDNGLLMPAADRLGGVIDVVEISRSKYRREPVSQTFHGRDIFAPVAAELASGLPLREAGDPMAKEELSSFERQAARVAPGLLAAAAEAVDTFGNVRLAASSIDLRTAEIGLGDGILIRAGDEERVARYVLTFSDVAPGATAVYEDASSAVAIAVNTGDAAMELKITPGDEIELRSTDRRN